MAHLHSELPTKKGEHDLAIQLKSLPDERLHLWFGMRVPGVRDIDAIIWHESEGIFVVEVKAVPIGAIELYGWQRCVIHGRKPDRGPQQQAHEALHSLQNFLSPQIGRVFVTSVACWPQIRRSEWHWDDERVCGAYAESMLFYEDLYSEPMERPTRAMNTAMHTRHIFAERRHGKTPQLLFDFLKTNISKGKAFLTAKGTNERDIEFTYDPSTRKPVQPRDPRYQFITAQPYASSSYGFLQVTFLLYGQTPDLKKVLDPSSVPLYTLLTQPQKNFEIAARFHRLTLTDLANRNLLVPCGLTDCNIAKWHEQWYRVINRYNTKGNGYSVTQSTEPLIVTRGETSYAPE